MADAGAVGWVVMLSLFGVLAVTVMLVVSTALVKVGAVNVSLSPVCASVGAANPLKVATPLTDVAVKLPVNGPVPVWTVAVTTVLLLLVTTLP